MWIEGVMWLRYPIGAYGIARGGKYLFDGVMVFTGGVQSSLIGVLAGSMMFMAALFLLFAGSGMVMGHFWSVNFMTVLLGLDVLGTAGALALTLNPLNVLWLALSFLLVLLLVFTDPLKEKERPDIDEETNVHGLTSFQN